MLSLIYSTFLQGRYAIGQSQYAFKLFTEVAVGFCRQLIQDQLPQRKAQLYNTYGPGGSQPLIPAAQAGSPPLTIAALDSANQFVQIVNENPEAVDVSDYKLTGSTSITLRAGRLCILPTSTVTVFWKRSSCHASWMLYVHYLSSLPRFRLCCLLLSIPL